MANRPEYDAGGKWATMNQHQVYLKGELAKLRNRDDAQGFMSKSGCAEG